MAIQNQITLQVQLAGDGAATTFTFSPNKLFELFLDAGLVGNPSTPATSAAIVGVPAGWPAGQSATVDIYGNLTLTFASAPPATAGYVQVQLNFGSGLSTSTAAWTSATALNTALTQTILGYNTVAVTQTISGTITGGAVFFEVSSDNVNWFAIQGNQPQTFGVSAASALTGNGILQFNVAGYAFFRVRLQTAITGAGTATVTIVASNLASAGLVTVGQPFGQALHMVLDDASGGNAVTTSTQGVQGSRALMTQDFKDSGRTQLTFFVDQLTGVTTEALASMQITKALVTQTAATNYTVTAGQTLRIKTVTVTVKDTTTTLASSRVRIRAVPSGTVAATSPIIFTIDVPGMTGTQAANVGNTIVVPIPDGLELPSGANFGFSHIESTTSSNISVCIEAFEY